MSPPYWPAEAAPVAMRSDDDPHIVDVLTLNVWGLPWPIARSRRQRFSRILDQLTNREDSIVGLQELWGRTHQFLSKLNPLRPDTSGDSGLALAGTLRPKDRPAFTRFTQGKGADALKSKGILEALIQLPGGEDMRVFVTHMQAGVTHGAVRASQVDQLLERAAKSRVATVLMGDFNLHDESGEDEASAGRLAQGGFLDAAVQAGNPTPTYASNNPFVGHATSERFDRVYLRSGPRLIVRALSTEVLDRGPVLSDHHPLWARLRTSKPVHG